ncbi:MAG TPA: hypothetical protein VEL07_15970 [Planctomycetota bacterium]|nr:hypothetical protein [Planctomycetota bacterium]
MNHIPLSCFSGCLVRRSHGWVWSDGSVETRITEIPSINLDLRTRDETPRLVEVPITLAESFDALRWVFDGVSDGSFDVDVSSGCFPALGRKVGTTATCLSVRHRPVAVGVMVVLVPHPRWQAWCVSCPIVPLWRPQDEADLQQRAIELQSSRG